MLCHETVPQSFYLMHTSYETYVCFQIMMKYGITQK